MRIFYRTLVLSVLISMTGMSACGSPQTPSPIVGQINDQTDLFSGQWKNQMGSGMVLKIENGQVSGLYFTNVGAPDKGKQFPITGAIENDQIVFFVNFKGFGSMTAWVGQITKRDGQQILRTQWHNTKDIDDPDEQKNIWSSIRTGGSDFVRITP